MALAAAIICTDGMTSKNVAEWLVEMHGYRQVYWLPGGFFPWEAAGYPWEGLGP